MNMKQCDEISNEIDKCITDLRIRIKKEYGIDISVHTTWDEWKGGDAEEQIKKMTETIVKNLPKIREGIILKKNADLARAQLI